MKREKKQRKEKAPAVPVRLSLEEREQLRAYAADEGKRDSVLLAEIVSAALKKRARHLKRLQTAATRAATRLGLLRKTVPVLPGQIGLFDDAASERREA